LTDFTNSETNLPFTLSDLNSYKHFQNENASHIISY